MAVFAVIPGATIIYFPVIIFIEFLLVLGLSFALASLNVFYRDIQYIWAVIIQAGFFAAPIIYPVSLILIAIPRSSAAIGTTHSRNFLSVGTY